MGKLRVSIVEFLNTAPLVWGLTHGPLRGRYDLSFTVPSLCAEALRSGEVDLAIIPAVEYQRIPGLVVLPDMAVASKGEVRSLLVVSKRPIEAARRIALDTSSRSSVALTRLFCRGLWHIAPEFLDRPPDPAAMLAEADAALVIGDPALRLRIRMSEYQNRQPGTACGVDGTRGQIDNQPIPGVDTLFIYDVAQQWRQMTDKSCVLAIWAGRPEAVTPEVTADFLASKEFGMNRIGEIAESAALQLDLPPRELEIYLRDNIDFSLDEENLQGLSLYFEQCAAAGLTPAHRPIVFAASAASGVRLGS